MKIIDPGHEYEVASLDGDLPQKIVFVKREGPGYPGNVGSHPGTTIQEVLRVCIDRLFYVYEQTPCAETEAAANQLVTAILLLELRAKRRKNKALDLKGCLTIDWLETCATCGHINCEEQHASKNT